MLFKKVDRASADSMPSGLDMFSTPMTQVAIEKSYEREFLTLNPIASAPFHFKLLTGSSFMDPVKTRLVTEWRLSKKKADSLVWEDTVANDNINVVNGLGATFIKNLKVTSGGQTIFNSNNLYSYKAHLDNELTYSEDHKKSSMNAFGYYYDNSGRVGDDLVNSTPWKERRDLFTNGKTVEFSAPLYADIFQQPRFLISNMEFELEIIPQDAEFLVHYPGHTLGVGIKLEMTALRLYATFVDLQPGVALDFERRLDKEPCKIPLRRSELKTIFLEPQRTETHNTAFPDYVPRNCTIAMIPKDNYNGTFKTDPMYFTALRILRDVHLNAGGVDVPYVPFDFDFPKGRYIRGFEHLHRTLGLSGQNIDCGINRKMFADGHTIFPFNLTTAQEDNEGFDFIREAPTMLHMKFTKEVGGNGAIVMIYGEWDSIMFIDKTRTVRTDLSV